MRLTSCVDYILSPVGYKQRLQTTTLTGHMVSELTGFLCLYLSEQHLPKKDAASWCLHFSTFPSDPSLKAWTAAVEIREERPRTHTEDLRHINSVGQDRSGSDWSGLQWQKTGSRICRQLFSLPLRTWINFEFLLVSLWTVSFVGISNPKRLHFGVYTRS